MECIEGEGSVSFKDECVFALWTSLQADFALLPTQCGIPNI